MDSPALGGVRCCAHGDPVPCSAWNSARNTALSLCFPTWEMKPETPISPRSESDGEGTSLGRGQVLPTSLVPAPASPAPSSHLPAPLGPRQSFLTFQRFPQDELMQDVLVDVLHVDHVGVVCEDELLVLLQLLAGDRRQRRGVREKEPSWGRGGGRVAPRPKALL